MRERRRFLPIDLEPLECRVVLSRASLVSPISVAPLDVSGRKTSRTALTIDQINQTFNSFTDDFLRAQGAYFASTASATDSKTLFRDFIKQRLNLLSQQLTRTFIQLPGSTTKLANPTAQQAIVVQAFLRGRITSNSANSLNRALAGTNTANSPIPPDPTQVAGSSVTLYTYQATSAIETARTATLNAAGYLINGTFKNHR